MRDLFRLAQNTLEYKLKKKGLKSAPIQVSVEPTNICNFRCDFCPQSKPGSDRVTRGKMTFERFACLLDALERSFFRNQADRKISFTHDGEPFVNERFTDFLIHAWENQFKIKFASNGLLATEERLKDVVDRGVRFNICIDFCADPGMFDKYRGFDGSHAGVLENLRYLAGIARKTGQVSLDICDISGWSQADGYKSEEGLTRLKTMFEGLESSRLFFSKRIFHNMSGDIETGREAGGGNSYRVCPYPWFNFNVAWNGDVVLCCRDLTSKTVLGNVFEDGDLWRIWNSGEYRRVRASLAAGRPGEISACRGCDLPWDRQRWKPSYVARSVAGRLLRTGRK